MKHPSKVLLKTLPLSLTLLAGTASADLLGLHAGAGGFNSKFDGNFRDDGASRNNQIDLNDDLDISRENNLYLHASLDHPLPLIPNVRIAHTQLQQSGSSTLDDGIQFAGVDFPAGVTVQSDIDLTHSDATLYYSLLNNWIHLDYGISARRFDGEIELRGEFQGDEETAARSFRFTIPLGYANGQFDLPFTGLSAGIKAEAIGYSGNQISDLSAWIAYRLSFGLGVEAGIRSLEVKVDDQSGVTGNIDFTGAFVGLTVTL